MCAVIAGDGLLLASASQDRFIRIWTIKPVESTPAGGIDDRSSCNGHTLDMADLTRSIAR